MRKLVVGLLVAFSANASAGEGWDDRSGGAVVASGRSFALGHTETTPGANNGTEPVFSLSTKGAQKWEWQSDSGSFNGVPDYVTQWGYNASGKTSNPNAIRWFMQWEATYQPDADPNSMLSEFHINFYNKAGDEFGQQHRPLQINAYHENYNGYTQQNKYDFWINAEFVLSDATRNVTALRMWDYGTTGAAGAGRSVGDLEVYTKLIAGNGQKWLKQKNTGGSAYYSLIYLDNADVIRLGDETSPLRVAVPGKLNIGTNAATNPQNAALYSIPTITAAASSEIAGHYFAPIIQPVSGTSNLIGSEFWADVTLPSGVTTDFVSTIRASPPSVVKPGGAVATNTATLQLSAGSSGTNNYALYSTGDVYVNGANYQVSSANGYYIKDRGRLTATADGVFQITNFAGDSNIAAIRIGKNTSGSTTIATPFSDGVYVRDNAQSAFVNVNAAAYWAYGSPGFFPTGAIGMNFRTSGFTAMTSLDGNNTDGKLTVTNAAISSGFTLDGTADGVLNVQARDGSTAGTVKSGSLTATALDGDLAVGSCTAGSVRRDTGGATREFCICNQAGTAYDCASFTTANGPTD